MLPDLPEWFCYTHPGLSLSCGAHVRRDSAAAVRHTRSGAHAGVRPGNRPAPLIVMTDCHLFRVSSDSLSGTFSSMTIEKKALAMQSLMAPGLH